MMWQRIFSMVRKEFTQLFRDWPILFILVWAFSGAIYVAGHAVKMDVSDYPVVLYDLSKDDASRELASHIRAPYFKIVGYAQSDAEVVEYLDRGKASLAIIIPPDFQRQVAVNQGRFQVISDGTISRGSILATSYIARITGEYNLELLEQRLGSVTKAMSQVPQVDARIRIRYNPNVNNAWFSSMLEMLNLITMVSMLLSASAMVREKVYGTLEQIMVTPLRPMELFIAKIIPTVVVVPLFSTLALFGVVQGVFDTPIRGSLLLFYCVMAVYVFSVSSLGLLVAVFARNIAQAAMILFLIMFPMLFLSGAMTPPESMATWMKYTSLLSPMRYFIDFGYQVLFKGNGIQYVWRDIVGIFVLGTVMFSLSVWRFRKAVR